MAEPDKSPKMEPDPASDPASGDLSALAAAARAAGGRGFPPVHLWNPPHCGDIGLRIARDGTWHYRNSPIGRIALVKLFASVLRKDPEGHVLVTPVEKVSVEVEDAPFLGVELEVDRTGGAPALVVRTNLDDIVRIGADHPLRFEKAAADGLKPYIRVRGDLWALATRSVLLDLVELGETRLVDGVEMFGILSQDVFFAMAPASDVGDMT
jgi:uncharacterized protein